MNPDNLSAKAALAYVNNREEYMDWQKKLWKQAAADLFGD